MVLYPLIGSRKDRALGDDAACLHKVALTDSITGMKGRAMEASRWA
ncbi:hypothetical protein [Candidatus Methylomirabilis sp.]